MQNEQINGLTTNHKLSPLPEQKGMWALNVEEMESSSKIDIRDVPWWKFIKDICRPGVPVTAKLLKEGCISLTIEGRPFYVACKHD
jgi:hypothetical protein